MAEQTIKNEYLTVVISTCGAEIKSVKGSREFMWNGDKKFWAGIAPVLFPICGGLKEDKFTYCGEEYTLNKHGFAKASEFELESAAESEATFLLKSNGETLKSYPFEFELRIKYSLDKNTLNVSYSVKNPKTDTMYFSIGAHEAYSCPGGIENYTVIFEKNENLNSFTLHGNLLGNDTTKILENDNKLALKYDYFAIDALVFKNINSRSVVLSGKDTRIKVDFEDFEYLLFWTKPGAPYICIEPWQGIPDTIGSDYDITKKEGIIALNGKSEHIAQHKITFE